VFIKTTRASGREYIKLVESYKEKGVTRHRVLFNFGRADLIRRDESFLRIVKRLCEVAEIPLANGGETVAESGVFDDCSEAALYNYGYLAYLKLWETLGIRGCLEEAQSLTKISYSLPDIVFLMAVQHLLEPRSKLSTYENKHKYFNLPEISLHHMYRALDKLADQKEHIETGLFQYNYIRLNKTVDVVFYDVTTISFESVIADDLRNFGFSKECRFNEVQVVMGMLIDSNGIPVGYELFPGNTFDGKTIVKALENIKKRFGISRVIIVADRGINSKQNLTLIKEAGYEYIVASKIRGMCAKMQEKILAPDGFVPLGDGSGAEQGFLYKTIEYENVYTDSENAKHFLSENLVITYSPKRAKKDASDRARLVEKAEKLLKDPEKINALNKRGGKKYINRANPKKEETWKLDADKIEKDARFDGYYGIQSSAKNLSAIEVVDAYSMLWKIEESFRIMKSTLEVQPVYHWSENRIKGHFVVCFLAFLMERNMEQLLAGGTENERTASPLKIRDALTSMQLAAVTASGQNMLIKTKSTPLSKLIFKKLHIPLPANINSHANILELYKEFYEHSIVQLSLL
jgi:transposase